MSKWIAEFELEDGDTMPEHMDLEYKGVRIDFHCKPQEPTTKNDKIDCQHTDCNNCVNHKYCDYESTTKDDLALDAISREKAIKWAEFYTNVYDAESANESIMTMLKGLPPVTPQDIDYKAQYERFSKKADIVISQLRADRDRLIRPKGHWICDGKGRSFADYHCSECGLKLALCGQDIKQRQDSGYSLFCGGCGADMREVVEE